MLKRVTFLTTGFGGQMISPLRQAKRLERAQGCLLGQLAGDALGSLVAGLGGQVAQCTFAAHR